MLCYVSHWIADLIHLHTKDDCRQQSKITEISEYISEKSSTPNSSHSTIGAASSKARRSPFVGSYSSGAAVGAGVLCTNVCTDEFTGVFTDVFTDAFPDIVTGAFADVFTGVFTDVFTGVFTDVFIVVFTDFVLHVVVPQGPAKPRRSLLENGFKS